MAFQNQKDGILKFYESTNQAVDQHKQTYGDLVTKLNEKAGLTQTLTNNLDSFMEHSFPEFNTFKQEIQLQPLEDSLITYVYDLNKGEYITNFTLPNKKIIVKQNFKCVLMKNKTDIAKLQCGTPCTHFTRSLKNSDVSYTFRNYMSSNNCIMEMIQIPTIKKMCNCTTACSCNSNQDSRNYQSIIMQMFDRSLLYHHKETKDLEIWIDDYLNIYIPSLKTYLVFNYSKFPLYSFFINIDKLNLYHNYIKDGIRSLMFNEDCPNDLTVYNLVKSFVDSGEDYLSSQDKRNHYKTLFSNLLTFYQYENKQLFFAQYQSLSEKLEQLAPSAKDTMDDEHKIFAQSQRIRELEVVNQKQLEEIEYLRNERIQFIEKDNSASNKLTDYQQLLEELNTQLHNEIDKTSIQQKEVIRLKNINLECNELKSQYRRLEDANKSINTRLNESEDKLSTLKTLNNTLIDKQTESLQKIILERNVSKEHLLVVKDLKLDIEEYNIKIKELETAIACEKEQHVISKSKIDELIINMSKNESNIDDQYQEILLSQLNDKNDEIKQLQQINSKLTKDIKNNKENSELIISKISSLLK